MAGKNVNNRSACVNIFSEHLLTDKRRYYVRMNSISYYLSCTDFYGSIFLYYLHLCIDYFIIYWFLQFTTIHVLLFLEIVLSNWNNRTNDAWGGVFWKSISKNEIFSFWKPKISFTEMYHESIEKQFNIKIHCEINVKLVFHEIQILWKKNFTVYPSLKIISSHTLLFLNRYNNTFFPRE